MLETLGTMKEIGIEKELETNRETVINDDTAKKDELTGEPGKVLTMKCRLVQQGLMEFQRLENAHIAPV